MSRVHEESAIKSERIADVWKKRREKARAQPMNGVGPAWLRLAGGRWQPIPERVAVVCRIFRLAIEGYGLHAIVQILNGEKVPTMGRGEEWVYSYVGLILRNRAVLGELQPHVIRGGKRGPTGKPVVGYYPAVISEAEFYQAAAALDGRKNQKGPRGKHVRNLFTGLLRDASDGCTLVTVSESDKCKTVKLVSSRGQRGHAGSTYRTFPYQVVEDAFLRLVKALKASDVLPAGRGPGLRLIPVEGPADWRGARVPRSITRAVRADSSVGRGPSPSAPRGPGNGRRRRGPVPWGGVCRGTG
jgi:Recombinase